MDTASIRKIFKDSTEEYIDYVMRMTHDVESIGKLIAEDGDTISPASVNTALALYLQTNLMVLAEYQRQKIEAENVELEYDLWFSEQYEIARRQIITEYEDNSKIKPSTTEYTVRAKMLDPVEYARRTREKDNANARMRYMLHVRELLASYDHILTTISSNMRQEMVSLSLDRRMNATESGVSRNRIRTMEAYEENHTTSTSESESPLHVTSSPAQTDHAEEVHVASIPVSNGNHSRVRVGSDSNFNPDAREGVSSASDMQNGETIHPAQSEQATASPHKRVRVRVPQAGDVVATSGSGLAMGGSGNDGLMGVENPVTYTADEVPFDVPEGGDNEPWHEGEDNRDEGLNGAVPPDDGIPYGFDDDDMPC